MTANKEPRHAKPRTMRSYPSFQENFSDSIAYAMHAKQIGIRKLRADRFQEEPWSDRNRDRIWGKTKKTMIAASPGPHMISGDWNSGGMGRAFQLAECVSRHQKSGQDQRHARK